MEINIEVCTCCRILLSREQRLSEAIETIRNVEVDEWFTATVMNRLPARLHKRTRDRRGLKLAIVGGVIALAVSLGNAPLQGWDTGIPSAVAPSFPADIADPAVGSLISFAQMILMALQTVIDAPLVATAVGATPLLFLFAALSFLAAAVFGSTLVALYFLGVPAKT